MSIAVDLGAYQFSSLRRSGGRLVARSNRSVFSILPNSVAHQQILRQAGLSYSSCEDGLLLLGNAAHESSRLFNARCRPLLPAGRVPEEHPLKRQLIGALTESVLPKASHQNEICCFSVPGGGDPFGESAGVDFDFLSQIIRLQGYRPQLMPASLALILSQLVDNAFTGIGLIFGSSGSQAMLAHRGKPICHVETRLGGDWVDEQIATRQEQIGYEPETGAHFLNTETVQRRRESVGVPLAFATSAFEQETAALLRKVVEELMQSFQNAVEHTPRARSVPGPLPFVCSGGLSKTVGFDALIRDAHNDMQPTFDLLEPQIVSDSERSIPRGLLISAELEAGTAAA